MSHVTSVDLMVKDLDCLRKACMRLGGIGIKIGQKTYKWFGRHVGDYPIPAGFTEADMGKCDHAIGCTDNKSAYEIGVVKGKVHQHYTLIYDFWGSHGAAIEKIVGPKCSKLKQAYAAEVAKKAARKQGLRVREQVQTDGTIKLTCTGG